MQLVHAIKFQLRKSAVLAHLWEEEKKTIHQSEIKIQQQAIGTRYCRFYIRSSLQKSCLLFDSHPSLWFYTVNIKFESRVRYREGKVYVISRRDRSLQKGGRGGMLFGLYIFFHVVGFTDSQETICWKMYLLVNVIICTKVQVQHSRGLACRILVQWCCSLFCRTIYSIWKATWNWGLALLFLQKRKTNQERMSQYTNSQLMINVMLMNTA